MKHIDKRVAGKGGALGLIGLALAGASCPAGAEDGFRGPPSPAEHRQMLAREADDMALLLGLRPDQRPALDAFLQSQTPPAPPRPARTDAQDVPPRADDFAQHLQRMEEMARQRSDLDTKRFATARSFYASLDQRQRSAFEALMRVRGRPGGPGGPGGPDGPGGLGGPRPRGPGQDRGDPAGGAPAQR